MVEELQSLTLEELKELKRKIEDAIDSKVWYIAKGIDDDRSRTELYEEFLECGNIYAVYKNDDRVDTKCTTEEYLEVETEDDFRKWLKGFGLKEEEVERVLERVAEEMRKAENGIETDEVYVCTLWGGTDVTIRVAMKIGKEMTKILEE